MKKVTTNSKKLTEVVVKKASYKPSSAGYSDIPDTELKGFTLRVRESGQKSFVFRYRTLQKRSKTVTIGSYPAMTVDEARKEARQMKVDVDKGGDPLGARQAERKSMILDDYFSTYIEQKKNKTKTWAHDKKRYEYHLAPALGKIPLKHISTAELKALQSKLLTKMGKKDKALSQATVNRCFALLGNVFQEAVKDGILFQNPVRLMTKFKETKSVIKPFTADETARLLAAMDKEEAFNYGNLFKIVAMTARRVGEILKLRWADVDFENKIVIFPDTKAGEPQSICLEQAVQEILESIPRSEDSPYIFTGRDGAKPVGAYYKAWCRVLNNAGLPHIKLHALRHMGVTALFRNGANLPMVAKQVGHKSPQTTDFYTHLQTTDNRWTAAMLEKIWMGNAATKQPTNPVQG